MSDSPMILSSLWAIEVPFQKNKALMVSGREFHGLTYRYSGRIRLEAGGKCLLSGPGCLTYVPAGQSYCSEILESGRMAAVHFTLAQDPPDLAPWVFMPDHATVFRNLFSALSDRYKVGRDQDYACLSLFYEILAEIRSEMERKADTGISKRMLQVRDYMDRSFQDVTLSVSRLADSLGVSDAYFRRAFKAAFGVSPLAYIKKLRIDNAKALLTAGYYSVGAVARQCGFDSLSYFSYEFHRLTGMTPKEYSETYGKS